MNSKAADDLTFAIPMPHFHARPDMASVMAEPPPVFQGLIDKMTVIWWRLEALLERWKMGMKEHRIDPDFDPSENDVRLLRRAIEQLALARPSNYYSSGGNDKRALNLILGMVGTLVVSAIAGGIAVYGKVSALEERVNGMMAAHEARLTRLENINERRRYREDQ
jgi:hypothetical protein